MDKAITKESFKAFVYNTIKTNPTWGDEIVGVIMNGLSSKIDELKGHIAISQMAGLSGISFLIGKQKATKKLAEVHEHILLKSMLQVDGIGNDVIDNKIKQHCGLMKDWIDKLYVKIHEDDNNI